MTLAAGFVLAMLLSPIVKIGTDALVCRSRRARKTFGYHPRNARHHAGPVEQGGYDFGRVFRPLLLFSVVGLLLANARRLGLAELLRDGFRMPPGGDPGFTDGLGVAVLSVIVLMALLWCLGVRHQRDAVEIYAEGRLWGRLLGALAGATFTGVLEESLFRGLLLGALLRERRLVPAIVIADLVYAAFHWLDGRVPVAFGFDPLIGFRTAGECLGYSLAQPTALIKLLGLLAVGGVLCVAFARSGSLRLGIGLHVGWVLSLKVMNLIFFSSVPDRLEWFYGSRGLIDGLLVWVMAIPVGAYVWIRPGPPRSA
jgi:membrane protease YdiL (CAAX protease family)